MSHLKILYTLGIAFFVSSMHLSAQDFSLYQKFKFAVGGDTLPYRILLPENYNPAKTYPLIVFLHGWGESGNDNEKQLTHGASLFLKEENRKAYPAIVVFPQNPVTSFWSNVQSVINEKGERTFHFQNGGNPTTSMKLLTDLINNLMLQYKVKRDQIYTMGLSMGGMATYELVYRMPDTFAAAISISGGANTALIPQFKHTSWWIFHGSKDNIVSSKFSENMVYLMKQQKVDVFFTFYPDVGHNCWDLVFKEKYLMSWLFSKVKKAS